MRDSTAFAIVATVLFGAGLTWFLYNYERVDVDERGPPSAVVRSNPNYGFSQFLERYDIVSRQLSSLNTQTQMPAIDDTLVIGFDAVYLTNSENVRIADWVAAGGHLVVPLPYSTDETMLEYFNITSDVVEQTEEDAGTEPQESQIESTDAEDRADAQSDESIAEDDGELDELDNPDETNEEETDEEEMLERYVYDSGFNDVVLGKFSLGYEVYDDLYSNRETLWTMHIERNDAEGEPDRRTYALGFKYGLGAISLLSDYDQWNNDNFYHDDNAFLSLALLTQTRAPGTIWFVQTIRRASLWQLIWRNAAHLLMWLALAIVLFFWWAGQRLGRVLPDPTTERREFNEHLIASGRYLWHHKNRDELLHSAQQALRNRARQRYPRLYALSESQADVHLQELLEEHHQTWVYAMKVPDTYTKPQFLEQIKAIQTLWKLL